MAVEHKECFFAGAVNSFPGAAVDGGGSDKFLEASFAPVLDLD